MKASERIWSVLWIGLLLTGAAAAIMSLGAMSLAPSIRDTGVVVLAISGLGIAHALTGLLGPVTLRRRHLPVFVSIFQLLHLAGMFIGTIVAAVGIVEGKLPQPTTLRLYATCTTLGLAGLLIGVILSSPRRRRWFVIVRTIMMISISLLAAALLILMWSRMMQRFTIVTLGIGAAGALGCVLTAPTYGFMLLRDRARRRHLGETVSRTVHVQLACPDCGSEQHLATGLSRCGDCGLALLIDVEEPRCECGYPLYGLSGGICPECGVKLQA